MVTLEHQKNGQNSSLKPGLSMIELSAIISRETAVIDKYLTENNLPQPGFNCDSPLNYPKLPDEIQKARETVISASKALADLATGPTESVRWLAWEYYDVLSLQAIYKYQIAKSFPVNETATFGRIAEKVNMDEVNLTRFLRHSMTNRIFTEVKPGIVAHTAISRVLAEDIMMEHWIGLCVDDLAPAAAHTLAALAQNPAGTEPTQTGFTLANGTTDIEPMFATISKDPARMKRLGGGMASLTSGEGWELHHLIDNYPFPENGTLVDVGGSHGFVCEALARKYPNMKFVVQDLPHAIANKPPTADERIEFQVHNFFQPQPVVGADVYFFRWIFHNHSDKYVVKILQALRPALKKGAKIVINDNCFKGPGEEGERDEKVNRSIDLCMLSLFNARERALGDYEKVFAEADARFGPVSVSREPGCRMSVIESTWLGEDTDVLN